MKGYLSFRKGERAGFTIIELLISIIILVIGLVGVLLVIPLGQRSAGRSALTTQAAILASEKIEELKSMGYTELTSQNEWSGSADNYSWRATIQDVAASDFQGVVSLPQEQLVKIVMEITYTVQGKERRDTFVTFYSEL